VASPSFSKSSILLAELAPLAKAVHPNLIKDHWTPEALINWIKTNRSDCIVVGTEVIDAKFIDQLPQLRVIGKYGVGLDNLDLRYLATKNIFVATQQGTNARSVAELVLGYLLGLFRNIFYSADRMQNGVWFKQGGAQLSGKTIGIVGLGFVGTEVARVLKALDCQVLYYDIKDKGKEAAAMGLTYKSYSDLVSQSDALTFHVPLDQSTVNMYGSREIGNAKSGQIVINTSRAKVVDFDAVVSAVKSGALGGFGCDVFDREPFKTESIKMSEKIILTSHIAGNSSEAVLAMGRATIQGLKDWLKKN
jgi:D-3-phosphoglycerate dehydrogenase